MYAFREVHEHITGMGSISNRTYWEVIHEDTGLWMRYSSKGRLPEGTYYNVFDEWVALSDEKRMYEFQQGKILKSKIITDGKTEMNPNTITNLLGNCTAATLTYEVSVLTPICGYGWSKQEKGNNPMRVEYNTPTASASVINSKSDEAYQREYLLTEFAGTERTWTDPKLVELSKLFNIGAPTIPMTPKALLEAFQNGKFTVDEKKVARAEKARNGGLDDDDYDDFSDQDYYSLFYGITFTDLPKEDRKGHDAAVKEYAKLKENTKRKIIVGTPAEGLDALLALEAWLPTGKAN